MGVTGRASLQIKADRGSGMIRGSLVRVSRGKMNFAAALLGTTAMSMLAAPAFAQDAAAQDAAADEAGDDARSEEHTSELQSLIRISYAVFCLKNKKNTHTSMTT